MKKKFLFVLLFIVGFMQHGYSNDSTFAKVVFYRASGADGYIRTLHIYNNDSLVTQLTSNSFFIYDCRPGNYNFNIDRLKRNRLNMEMEKGKTYYIKLYVKSEVWSNTPYFIIMDSVTATSEINRVQSKQRRILKSRIGFTYGTGFGFDNITWFTMTNGQKSNMSFGGGYGLGLKYGHMFSKHFDLALGMHYQFSNLSVSVEDASVYFGRGFVSATPSYILPIRGGKFNRLKFGGGLDYYLSPVLEIDSSKIPGGIDDKWQYKSALGMHLIVGYEMNFAYRWSLNVNVKYYNVKYKFHSSNNLYYPLTKNLDQPNGSGIDLLLGINYHF